MRSYCSTYTAKASEASLSNRPGLGKPDGRSWAFKIEASRASASAISPHQRLGPTARTTLLSFAARRSRCSADRATSPKTSALSCTQCAPPLPISSIGRLDGIRGRHTAPTAHMIAGRRTLPGDLRTIASAQRISRANCKTGALPSEDHPPDGAPTPTRQPHRLAGDGLVAYLAGGHGIASVS
jgi:hypothetical protein